MDWTFPVSGPIAARLDLAAGSVEVELGSTDEAKVRLTPLGPDSDRAREQIEHAEVTCDGSRLEVSVPKRWPRESQLRLNVVLPARSAVRVKTASADIACAGTLGVFEVKTASGDVFIQDDCDDADISTASGDIRLAGVLGQAEIRTASGDVFTHAIGGQLSITTASGDVRAAAVAHDARIRSASGDVSIGTAFEGDLTVNTASGDVKIGVGSGVGTWLDLVTVSGTTRCTLPTEGDGKPAATLRISCHTVSGDILVRSGDASPARAGEDAGTGPAGDSAGDSVGSGPAATRPAGDSAGGPVGIGSAGGPVGIGGNDDLDAGGASSFAKSDSWGMPGQSSAVSSAAELLGGLGAVLGDLNLERLASWRGQGLPWRRP